jgi:hypothetical protein
LVEHGLLDHRVACWMGRSAGFAPLRILSTKIADSRQRWGKLTPQAYRHSIITLSEGHKVVSGHQALGIAHPRTDAVDVAPKVHHSLHVHIRGDIEASGSEDE